MRMADDDAIPRSIRDKANKEDLLLTNLIRLSVPFGNFYKNERGKIRKSLYWVDNDISSRELNISLPEGHLARAIKAIDGTWLIILKQSPLQGEDASIVAHELAHIVLDSEGFPFIETTLDYRGDPDFESLAFSLNNLLQDPLVIIKLQSYGFELYKEYYDECQEAISALKKVNGRPDGIFGIKLTIDYIKNLLENDLLHFYQYDPCREYSILFEQIFPFIDTRAKKLHKMIVDLDYHQMSNITSIYRNIIDFFNLAEFLQVKNQ
jgi:hypothetical protein